MHIQINQQFALGSDRHAWTIKEKVTRKRKGRLVEEWQTILWFASIEQAVHGLANLRLRQSDAQTVAEALHEVNIITAELCGALQPHFEVKVREGRC